MITHPRFTYYKEAREKETTALNLLSRKSNQLVLARLATAIAFIAFIIPAFSNPIWIYPAIAPLAGFIALIRVHQRVQNKKKYSATLVELFEAELTFIENNHYAFADGEQFNSPNHPYSNDLDLFGPRSLYQYLNRTGTVMGSSQLATYLLTRKEKVELRRRQEAIEELSALPDWRFAFRTKAILAHDSAKLLDELGQWNVPEAMPTKGFRALVTGLPILGGSLMAALIVSGIPLFFNLAIFVFVANIILLASRYKLIQNELTAAEKISETLRSYGELMSDIEQREWKSELMKSYAVQLRDGKQPAGALVSDLSQIFSSLESIQNGFGAILFNGTVLYHLHTYHRLLRWKKQHNALLSRATEILGEVDALNSLAQLLFNNPTFCFPEFNDNRISFTELGHPLISPKNRVCNSIDFSENPFVILTGSNMAGKSTFLRTVGINLVLANAGSVICAKNADVFPIDLLASMRLSDSLADSESYFFAEVKRLEMIVKTLDQQRCFVLLDEILRGTNSDDKRSGTIAVVEKMVQQKAIGMVATHDLEVCQTTDRYTHYLTNKCFEVEILNDELHFDYLLREGICQNKSATFLMKKMGVI